MVWTGRGSHSVRRRRPIVTWTVFVKGSALSALRSIRRAEEEGIAALQLRLVLAKISKWTTGCPIARSFAAPACPAPGCSE
jgi:hypothetical protein